MDIKVKLETLTGFMVGPESLTFQVLKKENKEMAQDLDEWQYVSLCDYRNITYDFRVKSRQECLDFIIGVSEAAMAINKKFFGLTNRKLLASIFTRNKLKKIAAKRKLTVHQMVMIACFDSIGKLYPEDSTKDKRIKY